MDQRRHPDEIHRYNELPWEVREWIANLRKQDIEEIDEARRFIRSVKTAGNIWKYVFLAFLSAIIVIGSVVEYFSRFFQWLRGQ